MGRIKEAYPRGMMAAFRDILSTVARKKPFYSCTSWSRDLSDFFFSFYEDEKSPSHRISQVDICACIHHLPPRAKSNRDFPFLLHREFIPIDFPPPVLFIPIIHVQKIYISSEIVRILRKKNF